MGELQKGVKQKKQDTKVQYDATQILKQLIRAEKYPGNLFLSS